MTGRDLPREKEKKTMTIRDLYTNTINTLRESDASESSAELIAEFESLIQKLDTQNAARKAKAHEKAAAAQAEKQPIRDALFAAVSDAENPKTASMLIADAGLEETVKPASVPSLMKPFVDAGTVVKVDMKVPGHGTQRGYVLA